MIWKPKSNQHYIEDQTGAYRISGARVNGQIIYTAWYRNKSIKCGNLEDCRQACDEHIPNTKEAAASAIEEAKRKLR